jgi:hypothetical protein
MMFWLRCLYKGPFKARYDHRAPRVVRSLLSGLVAGGMCAVPAVVNCAEFVAKAAIEEREYILLGIAKRE